MTGPAAMSRGVDYAGARPDPRTITADGGHLFMRYSAGAGNAAADTQFKLCGLTEIAAVIAAGGDFLANSEWYTSRITEGAAAGHADGLADLAFWHARGYPAGAGIAVSWDEGQPNPAKHDAVAAYLTAYAAAQGRHYQLGLYGGDVAINAMLDRGVITFGWRAMSESWSGPTGDPAHYQPGGQWRAVAQAIAASSRAHVWQNGNQWLGGDADENVVLRPGLPSYLAATGQQPKPVPVPPKPAPIPTVRGTYTVRAGDTFWGIEVAHGWAHGTLHRLNPAVVATGLRVGQLLHTPADGKKPNRSVYVIRRGDTFWAIEAAHDWAHGTLHRLNPAIDPARLQVGQAITIP